MHVVAADEPRGPDERQEGDEPEVAGCAPLLGRPREGQRRDDGETEEGQGRAGGRRLHPYFFTFRIQYSPATSSSPSRGISSTCCSLRRVPLSVVAVMMTFSPSNLHDPL